MKLNHNNIFNHPLLSLIAIILSTLLFSMPAQADSHQDTIVVSCTDLNDLNSCTVAPESASLNEIIRTINDVNQCKVSLGETSVSCPTSTGDITCEKNGNQASCLFPGQILVECDNISNNSASCQINKPNSEAILNVISPFAKTAPEQEVARVISDICLNDNLSTDLKRDCRGLIDIAFSDDPSKQDELQKMLEQITPSGATVAFDTAKISGQNQIRSLNHFLTLGRIQNQKNAEKKLRIFRYNPLQRKKVWFGKYSSLDQSETIDPVLGNPFSKLGVFVNGSFGKSEKDTVENELGFTGDNIDFTTGFDYRFSSRVNLGTAFGLSKSENTLASNRGQVDFTSYTLLFFGAFYPSPVTFVNLVVSYAGNEYDQERRFNFTQTNATTNNQTTVNQVAQADYFGNQTLAELSMGISKSFSGINLETSAHLQMSRAKIADFREQFSEPNAAGSGWALKYNENKSRSTIVKLGTQANYAWSNDWGVMLPQIGIYWNKELESSDTEIIGSFVGDPNNTQFTLPSNEGDSNYFDLNTALTALLSHGRMIFLSYQTLLAFDDYKASTFTAGMRMEF